MDIARVPEISMISLRRLIDGGAAILVAIIKNHKVEILGIVLISPFDINTLRVLVTS